MTAGEFTMFVSPGDEDFAFDWIRFQNAVAVNVSLKLAGSTVILIFTQERFLAFLTQASKFADEGLEKPS